eukprot:TRINITY_DN7430_c0_g1_i1.p2 TRINITY_DN7430_c0_g1~~TRINITY_DN7430_c0_g1_i1.p2  ORF type:complete len:121 (+),score=11.39 TRINITY_DN7430_c0_g1_i1:165-527(+)
MSEQDPYYGQSQNVNVQATSKSIGFGRTQDVRTSQVMKTLETCKQVYSQLTQKTDLPQDQKFKGRLNYIQEITGEKKDWWLENVAACGAPDDVTTDTTKEVHLVLMSRKEIESWLLTGRY